MIVKDCLKILTVLVMCVLVPVEKAFASSASFSLYPNGGIVVDGANGFVVDVLIDTGGKEIISAKFTLLFDPRELQLTRVERNNSLFAQWPEDESTVDNDNGVVMLRGFSQSGSGKEYVTEGEPDIFARLHFKALKKTDAVLDWEYNTNNGIFETVMILDGSPANQNILTTKPSSAIFRIGTVYTGSLTNTGISLNRYVLFTGVVLILFGGFMVFTRPRSLGKKKRTIVMYEGKKK